MGLGCYEGIVGSLTHYIRNILRNSYMIGLWLLALKLFDFGDYGLQLSTHCKDPKP